MACRVLLQSVAGQQYVPGSTIDKAVRSVFKNLFSSSVYTWTNLCLCLLLLQRIMSAQYEIPPDVHMSHECRDLMAAMLEGPPRRRITIDGIKRCDVSACF